MKHRTSLLLLTAAAALGGALAGRTTPLPGGLKPPALSTPKLSAAEFEKLHSAVIPRNERWTEIPWETELSRARQRAAQEGKPLLMWVMDGHPLGCT